MGYSTMAGLMEGRILPHCVGDDAAEVAQRCTRMCFYTWGEFCAPSHPLSQLADWKLLGHFISFSADMSVDCPTEHSLTSRRASDAEPHLPGDRPVVCSTII